METDTIVAIATPPGRGGVGILRLSGDRALSIGEAICRCALQPRHAHFCRFRAGDGTVLDSGIALYFPGPHSFTGDDVVELQAHGGPVILDMLVREVLQRGGRQAQPGEFSRRAYLNDRIDLAQAEAIADLINSTTETSALNASRSLQGAFSERIAELVERITRLRVYTEAAIDFPEEEIDFLHDAQLAGGLQEALALFDSVERQARQGILIQEGMKLVIAGRPNAGKSSLLNRLSGQDTAIVTAIEGTTRDVLRERIQIDGLPLHIADTAGLRDSTDEIELEGIRRARQEMASADRILLVVDSADRNSDVAAMVAELRASGLPTKPVTVILNKCDLAGTEPGIQQEDGFTAIRLSARTGSGIDLLTAHLKSRMGYEEGAEGHFSARRRHLRALEQARDCLLRGQAQLQQSGAGELLAEDLRQCQQALGGITGEVSSDQLLGEIFSSFCIGK